MSFFRRMLHNFAADFEMYGGLDVVASGPIDARISENSTSSEMFVHLVYAKYNSKSDHLKTDSVSFLLNYSETLLPVRHTRDKEHYHGSTMD